MVEHSRKFRAEQAWIALIGSIVAYEIFAPPGQLLTDGARRMHHRHPAAVTLTVMATALHLLGALPGNIDPYSHSGHLAARGLRWTGLEKFNPKIVDVLVDTEALDAQVVA